MFFEATPLLLRKLHSLPVLIPGFILGAEFDPPGFAGGTFRRCNMGLKLDRISAGIGDSVNKSMSHPQTAVVSLGNFTYYHTASI